MELGIYGRTNTGKIFTFAYLQNSDGTRCEDKVVLIEDEHIAEKTFYYFENNEHIVKQSKNMKDLIELNDYVNGYLVIGFNKNSNSQKVIITEANSKDEEIYHFLDEEDIETVLTHEQYEANIFKVHNTQKVKE